MSITYSVVITSGCRPELLRRTIDTFCLYCNDIDKISEWICIDDNTDEETREILTSEYPFITFLNKTKDQIGHAVSLNMLMPYLTTEYIIRLEDDWQFLPTDGDFIKHATSILDEFPTIGQVMFNKNYQQERGEDLLGGIPDETTSVNKVKFLWHDYASGEAAETEWRRRYGCGPSVLCSWPHFSLMPSLTRTAVFRQIGFFNEASSYFEYQYGLDYMNKGWRTVFLPQTTCIHIGRIINDRNGPLNAYEILNQEQFGFAPRQANGITGSKLYL